MKYIFGTLTIGALTSGGLTAGPVSAHTGHLAEVAGHGHWLGAAAIGAAIAIGLWAAVKGPRDAQASEEDAPDDALPEDEMPEADLQEA